MILKDLLKHIDFLTNVIIYEDVGLREEKIEEVYRGSVLNVPWTYADSKLYSTTNFESISIEKDEETKKIYLSICVSDKI